MKRQVLIAITTVVALGMPGYMSAHCQIPCGIYDDEMRVQLMEEHVRTVERSMRRVVELGAADGIDHNQLVRWIVNKEEHAQKIQDIVTEYFMAQRIKHPGSSEGEAWDEYVRRLTLLHQVQVAAMKAKQSTDLEVIAELRDLIASFRTAYFGEKGKHAH